MNATTVIGYTCEGEAFCADHKPDVGEECEVNAIFGDSETDTPTHCGWFLGDGAGGAVEECGELIPQRLTPDGEQYVRAEHAKGGARGITGEWMRVLLGEWEED